MSRLRIAHLRLLVPFVVIAWRAALAIGDNSFLWHVRAGSVQLDSGEVLRADVFSFTAVADAWRTQSWLVELGYGWLEDLTGGIGWVPVMKLVAISATVALVGLAIHKTGKGRNGLTLGGLLLIVWQATAFGVARPALLGFTLLAIVVAITYTERRPLWLLPVLFWLWAGVHGTYAIGLGYLFLDALRRRSDRQVVAVAVSGVATGLTAHGLGAWWILVQFFRNRDALELISEWQPPDFTNPFIVPLLIVIIGVLVAGALHQLDAGDLWVIIPFVVFGVIAERNVWPAVIVLAPLAARAFNGGEVKVRPVRPEAVVVNWVIAVALVAVAVIGVTRPLELSEDRFPVQGAIDALQEGPLFNGSAVGGYLIYAEWPERHVYIDDRAELYGVEGFQQFHDLKSGLGVNEGFADLGIEQALLKADWPLVEFLEILGWDYRYRDEFFVVMALP
ncbi:MAG: hypothetical protein U9N84_08835 [Actinomycetota bacterium]|nr:hypothetical protein [Actinomycetota bacterium]